MALQRQHMQWFRFAIPKSHRSEKLSVVNDDEIVLIKCYTNPNTDYNPNAIPNHGGDLSEWRPDTQMTRPCIQLAHGLSLVVHLTATGSSLVWRCNVTNSSSRLHHTQCRHCSKQHTYINKCTKHQFLHLLMAVFYN